MTKDGIEVTPEMIRVGYDVLRDWNPDWTDLTPRPRIEAVLCEVYAEMQKVFMMTNVIETVVLRHKGELVSQELINILSQEISEALMRRRSPFGFRVEVRTSSVRGGSM